MSVFQEAYLLWLSWNKRRLPREYSLCSIPQFLLLVVRGAGRACSVLSCARIPIWLSPRKSPISSRSSLKHMAILEQNVRRANWPLSYLTCTGYARGICRCSPLPLLTAVLTARLCPESSRRGRVKKTKLDGETRHPSTSQKFPPYWKCSLPVRLSISFEMEGT